MVSVVIAGSGLLSGELARWYRDAGATVSELSFAAALEPQLDAVAGPVDLLIIADGYAPATGPVASLDRTQLAEAMQRLTYQPFRLAAVLKPQLAAAQGRAVLLSRTDARMEQPDSTGRYLDRPFRTAAHTLWRSLSVEWRDAGIAFGLIGLDEEPDIAELAAAIAGRDDEPFPVEFTDVKGAVLGW